MKNKYNVHIISHTHWDREWYLNSKYTNEWLIPFFDNLFNMLGKESEYIFVLDGQTAMIEDYFEELDKAGLNPDSRKAKIRTYVKQKRLFIGPYYLQPDWQLLSEESLVRNMLIGNRIAEDLGGRMNTGWLLDNFGQISQTAQIHKEFGLKGLYVWRGVEMDPEDLHSEFLWQSPDGTAIPSIYLLDSYRNVMRLAEYNNIMKQRVIDEVDKLKPFATTSNILLMNGYDQEMIPDDLQPYLKEKILDSEEMVVFQSNPEDYMDAVLSENPDLKTLKGALYSGRFIAVFPGVMSSRMYLKLQNDEQQKALEKEAEPLSTVIWALGGEYEKQIINEAWKILLKNHPHDSICGVGIDDVHTDMEERSRIVNQLTVSQVRRKLEELIGLINTDIISEEEVKIVFNPSFYSRNEVVSFDGDSYLIKDIPSLGYKVIRNTDLHDTAITIDGFTAENMYIKLSVNKNGTFNVHHKETGTEYRNLGTIEDRADAGDEYNYSAPDSDTVIISDETDAYLSIEEASRYRIVFKIRIEMFLPESCACNFTKRSSSYRKMPVVTYLTMDADSPVVKCRTVVKNTVKDHIMRVLFPTNISTDQVYAGSPFDVTKRPIHIESYDETTIPEHVKKVIIGAREAKPNTIFLNREFVDLNNGRRGFAVLSKGLPEYQITGKENSIALTLFRSVGWIAKEINSRIGDAGPAILTPGAQCLREMIFEYAVYPHTGDTFSGRVCREADKFNTPLIRLITDRHQGTLNPEGSFFRINDPESSFKVTALKRSEDGRSIIIRGYNSGMKHINISLESFFNIKKVSLANLLENTKDVLSVENNTVSLKVDPKKIITLRIDIEREKFYLPVYSDITRIKDEVKEDFSEYTCVPSVTEEDIRDEKLRAEELLKDIDNPMITRTALEAQLSAILTRNRLNEIKTKELGYKLNEARVHRRIFDYIKSYSEEK